MPQMPQPWSLWAKLVRKPPWTTARGLPHRGRPSLVTQFWAAQREFAQKLSLDTEACWLEAQEQECIDKKRGKSIELKATGTVNNAEEWSKCKDMIEDEGGILMHKVQADMKTVIREENKVAHDLAALEETHHGRRMR